MDLETTVVGKLMGEVRSRATRSGQQLTTFRVSVAAHRWDRGLRARVPLPPTYFTVCCWGDLAAATAGLIDGDAVVVRGRLRQRHVEYEEEGRTRRRTFTDVDAIVVGLDVRSARVSQAQGVPAGESNTGLEPRGVSLAVSTDTAREVA